MQYWLMLKIDLKYLAFNIKWIVKGFFFRKKSHFKNDV